MKISIFLGAGASAAENCPIQSELFIQYFKNLNSCDFNNDMNKELYRFFKEIFNIDITKDNIENACFPTFEEVLGLIDLAEQRREGFKNFRLESLDKKSDSIRFLRQYLILLMAKSIHKSHTDNKSHHKLLIDNLKKGNLLENTTFISANYDIHLDNVVAGLYTKHDKIMLDYGIEFTNFTSSTNWREPKEPTVKLYKIHGSLNWLYCPICNSITLTPYEGGIMRLIDNIEEAKCLECSETIVPIIIPPTYFKNMTNIFISTVWSKVEKALRDSDILIFCGYSFADADIHIKYMLKRVQISRKKPPLKIMVFNNYYGKQKASIEDEQQRYKRFLGENVVFTDNSFEDFSKNPMRFISKL